MVRVVLTTILPRSYVTPPFFIAVAACLRLLLSFSDSENEILEFVAQIAHKDGGKRLLKVSHEEQAFKKTEPLQLISYEFSRNLKL